MGGWLAGRDDCRGGGAWLQSMARVVLCVVPPPPPAGPARSGAPHRPPPHSRLCRAHSEAEHSATSQVVVAATSQVAVAAHFEAKHLTHSATSKRPERGPDDSVHPSPPVSPPILRTPFTPPPTFPATRKKKLRCLPHPPPLCPVLRPPRPSPRPPCPAAPFPPPPGGPSVVVLLDHLHYRRPGDPRLQRHESA